MGKKRLILLNIQNLFNFFPLLSFYRQGDTVPAIVIRSCTDHDNGNVRLREILHTHTQKKNIYIKKKLKIKYNNDKIYILKKKDYIDTYSYKMQQTKKNYIVYIKSN